MAGRGVVPKITSDGPDFKAWVEVQLAGKIKRASTEAMEDWSKIAIRAGRKAIRGGGGKFSSSPNFSRGLKVKVYENSGFDPAAFIYHKIPYANIFETGGTIRGRPFLWLPTDAVKNVVKTPKQFRRFYPGKTLRTARRAGKPPMLVADLGTRKLKRGGFRPKFIPVFVAVPSVDINKRFAVRKAIEAVLPELGELYARKMRSYG